MNDVVKVVKRSLFLVLLLSCLSGCSNLQQPGYRIDYYTLEYDPPKVSRPDPLSVVVRLERFSVAPPYNTRRIIYRDRSFARNGYVYRQWRATPGDLATYFLARDMREARLFSAVLPFDSRLTATHVLEGSVDEFLEWDREDRWEAVLVLGVVLMAENEPDPSKTILFQNTYRAQEPCESKNPQALAEAMSRAMETISAQVTQDVYDHLKQTLFSPPQ